MLKDLRYFEVGLINWELDIYKAVHNNEFNYDTQSLQGLNIPSSAPYWEETNYHIPISKSNPTVVGFTFTNT